jgi:hypothetical protein
MFSEDEMLTRNEEAGLDSAGANVFLHNRAPLSFAVNVTVGGWTLATYDQIIAGAIGGIPIIATERVAIIMESFDQNHSYIAVSRAVTGI